MDAEKELSIEAQFWWQRGVVADEGNCRDSGVDGEVSPNTHQSTQAITKAVKLQPATADGRTDKGLVIVRIQSGMLVQVEHSVELSNTGCIGI